MNVSSPRKKPFEIGIVKGRTRKTAANLTGIWEKKGSEPHILKKEKESNRQKSNPGELRNTQTKKSNENKKKKAREKGLRLPLGPCRKRVGITKK